MSGFRRVAGKAKRKLIRVGKRARNALGIPAGPTILMYHRFNEPDYDPWELIVTPQHFDEQLAWLNLIRDHIATAISIEPDDLELSPFNQRGGLGKAHQLFGDQLPKLLDELNEVLAA